MKTVLLVAGIALAGCKPQGGQPCKDRVEALALRLENPRPIEEILQGGPPALTDDLKAVLAVDSGQRAVEAARRLERLVEACPQLVRVFGDVASQEGPHAKDAFLRREAPRAMLACECKASPEHAGGLIESMVGVWEAPR